MHGQSTTDDKASPKGNISEVLKPNEEGFHHQSEIKRISWWTWHMKSQGVDIKEAGYKGLSHVK